MLDTFKIKLTKPAQNIALSFILSSLVLGFLNLFIFSILPAELNFFLTFFIFALIILAFIYKRAWYSDFWGSLSSKNEIHVFYLLLILYAIWSLLLMLSAYPAQIKYNLGDWPDYYAAAMRLANGNGWEPNYFVADYSDGWLSYIKRHSLLIYSSLGLFSVFGKNFYSIHLYCFLASIVSLLLFGSLLNNSIKQGASSTKGLLLLSILPLIFENIFVYLGLGITSSSTLIGLLLLISIAIEREKVRSEILLVPIIAFYLAWGRPEGALFAVIFITLLIAKRLFGKSSTTLKLAQLFLAALIISSIWIKLPQITSAAAKYISDAAIFYTAYDSKLEKFGYVHGKRWWTINQDLHEVHFKNMDRSEFKNYQVGNQIKEHPKAFSKLLIKRSIINMKEFLRLFYIHVGPFEKLKIFAEYLLTICILSLFAGPQFAVATLSIMLLAILWPIFNPTIGMRHWLPFALTLSIWPLSIAIDLTRKILKKIIPNAKTTSYEKAFCNILILLTSFLIYSNLCLLVYEREHLANHRYLKIIDEIEQYIPKNATIISSYPQLISLLTDRRVIGGTVMQNYLEEIEQKIPDCKSYVIFENIREDLADNYNFFIKKQKRLTKKREVVVENKKEQYAILLRDKCTSR